MYKFTRIFGGFALIALACIPFLLIAEDAPASIQHNKFILVTPEKCGTHLLIKALDQLLDKQCINIWEHSLPNPQLLAKLQQAESENKYVHMHAEPTAHIFLIRDPRDQAISLYHYINKGWSFGALNQKGPYGGLSENDKILEIITGKRYGTSGVKYAISQKLGWMSQDQHFVYTARFENIVGAEGGGSRELQLMEIRNIASHIKINLSDEELQQRSLNLFGIKGEKTFRNGQIGEWKTTFKQAHIKAFKEHFGAELINMGYEKYFIW
jgi:hypothetical protein